MHLLLAWNAHSNLPNNKLTTRGKKTIIRMIMGFKVASWKEESIG